MTTQVSRQSQGLKNMDHVLLAIFCFPSFESPHSKPKMADLQRRKNAISHICMTFLQCKPCGIVSLSYGLSLCKNWSSGSTEKGVTVLNFHTLGCFSCLYKHGSSIPSVDKMYKRRKLRNHCSLIIWQIDFCVLKNFVG